MNLPFIKTIISMVLMIVFFFISFWVEDIIAENLFIAMSFISAVFALKSSSGSDKPIDTEI